MGDFFCFHEKNKKAAQGMFDIICLIRVDKEIKFSAGDKAQW